MSVSRKQCWDLCQAQYKYKYHDKIKVDIPVQPYFVYGDLVHKIAENYVLEKGKMPIENIASDFLKGKRLLKEGQEPPKLDADYQKKLPKHLKLIKTLSDRIGYDGHLEYPFRFDLNPPNGHIIVGFIDRLIIRGDKYFIIDYKTTKQGRYQKTVHTIKNDLQMRCYARVVQKEFNAKPENIRAALFYLEGGNFPDGRWTEQELIDTEEEMKKTYLHIINTSLEDVHGRLGEHCRRCDFRKVCTFYSLT
jgi:CRISPR/Cas system-associated exonuclease Cas4 (RecB family)